MTTVTMRWSTSAASTRAPAPASSYESVTCSGVSMVTRSSASLSSPREEGPPVNGPVR